jgi:hypothetical protein
MPDENSLTLREIDQARGSLFALHEDLVQFGRAPTRCHIAGMAVFAPIVSASLVIPWLEAFWRKR